MKIGRLRVEGFGNLKGDFLFSSDRCNLILEPNESGKSTLAAAVLASLYGFPRERASRERPIKIKEQYRPWSGGPYVLELELECGERAYAVRRDFDRDTATVLDGRTGRDVTAEFSRGKDHLDFGEALTGLTREDFVRCCFVGQKEIEMLRDASSLTHALQRIASSQRGDVVAGEALEALARAVERDYEGMLLGRGRVDTEIKRLDKEIDDLRGQMEAIAARRRESEDKIRSLEEATSREGQVEGSIARVDYLQLLAAQGEVASAIEQCERDLKEIGGYRAEIAALRDLAAFPAERVGELRELKGKIESLEERRAGFERKMVSEIEEPLERAERELASLAAFETMGEREAAFVSDRLAVLTDLWGLRRDKRRAIRQEERRLRAAGVEPARVTALASKLSALTPEDRLALSSHREKVLEVKAALSDAERMRDRLLAAEGGESPALVSLAAARRAETIALVAGVCGLALTAVLLLSLSTALPALATALVSLGALLYWATLLERRPVPGAEEFGSELQRIQTEIWALEKDQAALQEKLLNIASRAGYSKTDRLLDEVRELEGLQEKAAPLAALAASAREIQERYAAAAGELLDLMNRAGKGPASRRVTPRVARRFKDALLRHLECRQRAASLRASLEARVKELGDLVLEIEKLRAAAARLLSAALGPEAATGDLAAALARFEEVALKKERLDHLERDLLPSVARRSEEPPDRRLARLSLERDVLRRHIDRSLKDDPALEGLQPDRPSREYAEERRGLQEESRRTQRERLELSEALGDVLRAYRRDYPARQDMLARLEAARARAVAFRDAVALARDALTAISREAYAEWAEVLNDKTSEILRHLNPNYEDVRFDTDLSFTLRDARTARRLDQPAVDAQLSAGARDQIYLAVRMAAAEYLSAAGTRLPFVLDDPFASFDDARFDRALEFLVVTLARRHQVILLSCHGLRHRRWQETAPETLADRVRILDLTPLSA